MKIQSNFYDFETNILDQDFKIEIWTIRDEENVSFDLNLEQAEQLRDELNLFLAKNEMERRA